MFEETAIPSAIGSGALSAHSPSDLSLKPYDPNTRNGLNTHKGGGVAGGGPGKGGIGLSVIKAGAVRYGFTQLDPIPNPPVIQSSGGSVAPTATLVMQGLLSVSNTILQASRSYLLKGICTYGGKVISGSPIFLKYLFHIIYKDMYILILPFLIIPRIPKKKNL